MLLKETEPALQVRGRDPRPAYKRKRVMISASLVLGLFALILLWLFSPDSLRLAGPANVPHQSTQPSSNPAAVETAEPLKQCTPATPQAATPPAPVNLWASLTVPETVSITEWLSDPTRGLNLTSGASAVLSDNFIFHIEVYRPPKASALRYLASPSTEALPERYARVTIHHGGRRDEDGGPVVQDHLVGPLPVTETATMRKLTEIYHRDDVPFNARSFTIPSEMAPLLLKHMPKLAHAMQVCVQSNSSATCALITVTHRISWVALPLACRTTHSPQARAVR